MNPVPLPDLMQRVQRAVARSEPQTARRLCEDALRHDPNNLYALSFLSQSTLRAGAVARAVDFARRACALAPDCAVNQQNLGLALMGAQQAGEALSAFQRALDIEPEDLMYALFVALAMHACGQQQAACDQLAELFRSAPELRQAWRNHNNPALLRDATRQACALLDARHAERHAQVLSRMQSQYGKEALQRTAQYLDLFHGKIPPLLLHPLQRPSYQLFPGLTPKPYHPVEDFPWLGELLTAWREIGNECRTVMASSTQLSPYVRAEDHAPDSWSPLVDQRAWSALHLYRRGQRCESACQQCPTTAELLASLPMVRYAGTSPEAFFSILEPGAHIPPHYGLANIKLTVHLALEIPPHCGIQVGLQRRNWETGKVLIFDDSFLHEAWNRGAGKRAVLIFEIWHPELTAVEIEAIQALAEISHRDHA